MEPITTAATSAALRRAQAAYEKSKWCKCGHRHPKKSSTSSGYKRADRCTAQGCACTNFRTAATDAEMTLAVGYGKPKKWLKSILG